MDLVTHVRYGIFIIINYWKIKKVAALLADDKSKIVFWTKLKSRNILRVSKLLQSMGTLLESSELSSSKHKVTDDLTGEKVPIIIDHNQYFPSDIIILDNESFLDAGAYIGDTIESMINHSHKIFKNIYAFEPLTNNCKKIKQLLEEKYEPCIQQKIKIYNYGLSNKNEQLYFSGEGDQANLTDGHKGTAIPVVDIKTCLTSQELMDLTYIKMDIEGFELPVLQTMEEVIAIKKPKLAICVYHKPQDIVDIPLYLNKICPAYKLYLRHHTNWVFETVLYAVA